MLSTPPSLPEGLYALCDDAPKAAALVCSGVRVLQLRMKERTTRQALAIAREVVALCEPAGVVCLVNDRVDVALLAGAHGAHVGDEDLSVEDARSLLGPGRLLGATVRNLEDAIAARAAGADYVGLGPVFHTTSKEVPAQPLGVEGLGAVVARSPVPVVAIAGIGLSNIAQVAETGAHGAAVLSALFSTGDVAAQVRALEAAFKEGRKKRSLDSNG